MLARVTDSPHTSTREVCAVCCHSPQHLYLELSFSLDGARQSKASGAFKKNWNDVNGVLVLKQRLNARQVEYANVHPPVQGRLRRAIPPPSEVASLKEIVSDIHGKEGVVVNKAVIEVVDLPLSWGASRPTNYSVPFVFVGKVIHIPVLATCALAAKRDNDWLVCGQSPSSLKKRRRSLKLLLRLAIPCVRHGHGRSVYRRHLVKLVRGCLLIPLRSKGIPSAVAVYNHDGALVEPTILDHL